MIIMFHLIRKNCASKFKESFSREQKMSFKQQFLIALTLSLLFGLGWGVGLVATQNIYITQIRDTYATLFIFLTAFQGLWIFLMHCVKSKEVRREWKRWAYKAAGKEYSKVMLNGSSEFTKRASTRGSFATDVSYLSRMGTFGPSTAEINDYNIVQQEQFKSLSGLEKELEASRSECATHLEPSRIENETPSLSEIALEKTPDVSTSNSLNNITSTVDSPMPDKSNDNCEVDLQT